MFDQIDNLKIDSFQFSFEQNVTCNAIEDGTR